MADENKPAFYPRVGRTIAKNFRSAQPPAFIEDPRAMDIPHEYYDIPTAENREMSRRRGERIADLERQKRADTSPLEKLAGGLQAGRFMGSALTQAVNALPTRLFKGDEAADKFIQERIYKPEQPLAYEYAGDVGDFLEKLETEYKIPPVLPEAVALQYLTGPATSQAMRVAGKGAEQAGRAMERSMEPVVRGALEQGGLPREMVMAMGANTQSNVMKPSGKGANWLDGKRGSVEAQLGKMKMADQTSPEEMAQMQSSIDTAKRIMGDDPEVQRAVGQMENELSTAKRNNAINSWIDSNLRNYVKNQMATPDDPVRRLAEEGILHMAPYGDQSVVSSRLMNKRMGLGQDPLGMGKSDAAKFWERQADISVDAYPAGSYKHGSLDESILADNPWLQKVPDETMIYTGKGLGGDLGFDHIIDVLREDVATGRIRPEQLNKVSMEQAVRRTHEYDQELARKMNEARNTARADLPVYKDYPEGYRWIELNKPGSFAAESDAMGHSVRGYEPPKGHPDWTEGSGNSGSSSYGLGGWDAIKSGEAKVYSLVDSKGEPHTTIEIGKGKHPIGFTGDGNNFPYGLRYGDHNNNYLEIPEEKQLEIYNLGKKLYFENPNAYAENRVLTGAKAPNLMDSFQKAADMLLGEKPGYIKQIKGKQNRAPKEEYLPYVQDFVKGSDWSDVGDLQNAGFIEQHSLDRKIAKDVLGLNLPKYTTKQEAKDYMILDVNRHHTGAKQLEIPESLLKYKIQPDVPPAGMKRGGKVSISNNPDTMMLEVNNQKMAKGGLTKLLRAAPKSKAEIDAIARRMAPQMLGEFVRGRTGSQSVAEKTQKQFAKEKEMMHDIRPTGAERALPREVDIEELKDQVMVGIAGDPTISGQTLYSVDGVPLDSPSPQHGGPLYGLDRDDAFWASGLGAANRVQNVAREASEQYDLPVLGNYVMMGPDSINYAQHYADANLAAINPAKMSRGQIEDFNNLIRRGSNKSGPRPSFPGIENPSEAYLHFSVDPELRKHFNALMQMPTVTEKYNLPSGVDIRHAVTEPDLRDLEIGVTGKSIGRLRPEIEDLGYSEHPTYSHDIPGEFLGSTKYNIPYELSFPDTVKSVRENPKQAPQEFGSFKYVGPRQVIDQQLIDEIKQYQEMIKKYTGKKKGGAVKKAAGGAISGDDLILEERPL